MPRKPEGTVSMQINVPEVLHADLKIAALMDNRSMTRFILEAIKERVAKFREEDEESPMFVPPGLRG